MKLKIIIPLITLMTGVLLPTDIAEAASSAGTNKKETVNYAEQSGQGKGNDTTPQPVLSKEFHEIKFLVVLGLIGSALLLPEIFYKSKNKAQNEPENDHQSLQSDLEVNAETLKQLNLVPEESEKFNNRENNDLDLATKKHRAS